MLTVEVSQAICEALENLVMAGAVFTAYDVTKAARALTTERVEHGDTKNIIISEFVTGNMPNYDKGYRTLDKIDSKPFAVIYYPNSKSPDEHPLITGGITKPVSSSIPVNFSNVEDGVVTATNEGRINLPKKVVALITPIGGSYDVIVGGITFSKTPDKDGRVRFFLKKLGIHSNKAKVIANTDNNTIEIEPA